MLELKVLVFKSRSVNRLATRAVSASKVTPLAHEVGDNPVKFAVLEVQLPSGPSNPLLSGAQAPEILASSRHNVSEKLDHYSAYWLCGDV